MTRSRPRARALFLATAIAFSTVTAHGQSPPPGAQTRAELGTARLAAQAAIAPDAVADANVYFPDEKVPFENFQSRVSSSNFKPLTIIGLTSKVGDITSWYEFPPELIAGLEEGKTAMEAVLDYFGGELAAAAPDQPLFMTGARYRGKLSDLQKLVTDENLKVELARAGFMPPPITSLTDVSNVLPQSGCLSLLDGECLSPFKTVR